MEPIARDRCADVCGGLGWTGCTALDGPDASRDSRRNGCHRRCRSKKCRPPSDGHPGAPGSSGQGKTRQATGRCSPAKAGLRRATDFAYGLDDGVGDGFGEEDGDSDGDANGLTVGDPVGLATELLDGEADGLGAGTTCCSGGTFRAMFSKTAGASLKLSGMVPRAFGEIGR